MPTLQNLVLTDRASTPVNHTFVPSDLKQGVGTVVESTGVKLGDSKFSISSRQTANGRYRVSLKLERPKVENAVIDGVTTPKVTRVAYATVEFSFHNESTTQERTDMAGMIASALATGKTLVEKTVVDLEGVWG